MSRNFWQQRAPLIMLALAVAIISTMIWWQVAKQSPLNMETSVSTAAAASHSPQERKALGEIVITGSHIRTVVGDPEHSHDSHRLVSAQELQAELISELGLLDRKFQSEQISPTWSSKTWRLIDNALSAETLASKQAPSPIAHDAECRTFTCRIRVTYRTEMDAQMGEIFLLGDIATELPSANFGRLVAADGTIQIVMYANTGRAAKNR